jgi:hypothetical protein
MTRDEWNAVLATEAATPAQRGAIMGEFGRLGFGAHDRDQRLATAAAILGLDTLGSIRDLVMGDAGRLLHILQRTRDRSELSALASSAERGAGDVAPGHEGTLSGALIRVLAAVWPGIQALTGAGTATGKPGSSDHDRQERAL